MGVPVPSLPPPSRDFSEIRGLLKKEACKKKKEEGQKKEEGYEVLRKVC
jgi:hypothetical protein